MASRWYFVGAGFFAKCLDCSSTKLTLFFQAKEWPLHDLGGEVRSQAEGAGVLVLRAREVLYPMPKEGVLADRGSRLSQHVLLHADLCVSENREACGNKKTLGCPAVFMGVCVRELQSLTITQNYLRSNHCMHNDGSQQHNEAVNNIMMSVAQCSREGTSKKRGRQGDHLRSTTQSPYKREQSDIASNLIYQSISLSMRITRNSHSLMNLRSSSSNPAICSPEVKLAIQQAIECRRYDEALLMLSQHREGGHWTKCYLAKIQSQMMHIKAAEQTLMTSLIEDNAKCPQCYSLIRPILLAQRKFRPKHRYVIYSAIKAGFLSANLRNQYTALMKEVALARGSQGKDPLANCKLKYLQRGVKMDRLEVVEVGQDFRVSIAKSTIQPEENILFIPKQQLITLEIAESYPFIRKTMGLLKGKLRSPKHCTLSLFLLMQDELKDKSRYFEYIQLLPRNLETFPLFYSEEFKQKELKGTCFLELLNLKNQEIDEDYFQLKRQVRKEIKDFSHARFNWARMIISSRIFGISIHGNKTDALVPLADMLNHRVPKMTNWFYSDEQEGFVVQNMGNTITAGSEICDAYGIKCNSRFLMYYGFVQEDNLYNGVNLHLKGYRGSQKVPPNIRISINMNVIALNQLLIFYRLEIEKYESGSHCDSLEEEVKLEQSAMFISRENETKVWRHLLECLKTQLNEYPSTIKQDKHLLEQTQSTNTRNCTIVRLGEKKILKYYIKMASRLIDHFRKPRSSDKVCKYGAYLRMIGDPYYTVSLT